MWLVSVVVKRYIIDILIIIITFPTPLVLALFLASSLFLCSFLNVFSFFNIIMILYLCKTAHHLSTCANLALRVSKHVTESI